LACNSLLTNQGFLQGTLITWA